MSIELFTVLGPIMVVTLGALLCIATEAFLGTEAKHRLLPWLAAVALMLAALAVLPMALQNGSADVAGVLVLAGTRAWLLLGVLLAALCGIAALQHGLTRAKFVSGEAYALMLLSTVGIMIMVQASGYLPLYVGLEMASLAIYGLVGMYRSHLQASEGLFKYFIMGGVFSAILIYGVALTYGATGSVVFGQAPLAERGTLFLVGQTFIIIGLLFKMGAVPFHTWTPDAYTGASIGVTGFMAAVMKVGAVVGLGSVLLSAMSIAHGVSAVEPLSLGYTVNIDGAVRQILGYLPLILMTVAVLSLLLGTFSALGQTSLRRMLAYSGIAHAGYILLALVLPQKPMVDQGFVDQGFALGTLWYYLIAYAVAAAGTMLAAAVMAGPDDGDNVSELAGGGRRHPLAGLAFTILMASLAGLPPMAGFMGKFMILADLVSKGEIALALVAMLLAVVGAVFYLKFIVAIWGRAKDATEQATLPMNALATLALIIAVLVSLVLTFVPSLLVGNA